jgi:hypothetical protein
MTQQPLDNDRLTEIEESHPGDWYAGEWRSEYVEGAEDQHGYYTVKHQESGHVLAELPDFAGGIALFIADAHDAVPAMAAEIRRLRAELADVRAKTLTTEADEIVLHCPDHSPQDQDGVWMDCHCAVADDMRHRAAAVSAAARP